MSDSHKKGHDYHLVDPSIWPITISSFAAMILAFGAVYYMHAKSFWLFINWNSFNTLFYVYVV